MLQQSFPPSFETTVLQLVKANVLWNRLSQSLAYVYIKCVFHFRACMAGEAIEYRVVIACF